MKTIVSVSLGSSRRDHTAEVVWLGERLTISRRGTDGDFDKALAVLRELDGQVDAIGLGGIDVYLYVGGKRYVIGDGLKLLQAVSRTPVVDGSGVKNTLERDAVRHLARQHVLTPASKVLLVSSLDRFGMAEALVELGCDVTFGDLIFTLGVDYPIKTLAEVEELAEKYKSRMEKLPFTFFYPTGVKQDEVQTENNPTFVHYYREADVIAGDFHFVRKFMPEDMTGKVVLTQTTTAADVELMRQRGVKTLVTTTPVLGGRSFATNVMEAVLVALSGHGRADLTPDDYQGLISRLNLVPTVQELNP
ncbi:MAG: quinate 5-dehydrogenase [Symbiobacteriia bacterium]